MAVWQIKVTSLRIFAEGLASDLFLESLLVERIMFLGESNLSKADDSCLFFVHEIQTPKVMPTLTFELLTPDGDMVTGDIVLHLQILVEES